MGSGPAASGLCPEKNRLFGELKAANEALTDIHQTEMDALLLNNFAPLDDLGLQLQRLRQFRDVVSEALRRHIHDHGC